MWEIINNLIEVLADLLTIGASGIAIYLFAFRRGDLGAFFRAIVNFANQSSLAEVRQKLEELSSLSAADPANAMEIAGIFHDVCGRIDGNPLLKNRFSEFAERTRRATSNPKRPIPEPQKRALVSELRECLRHLDVITYAEAMGEQKK
ncbi:hypothetical protein K6X12_13190 [Xanthomonas euvesicatoria pv. allii]|uniref:hypothetical protein n=1 Tax=Xanthomonas euvesicatoria TaxID=456327 RepID=UPI002405DF30|nr:hypothetical protein [Xanthomonas euvesicatoria]MCP3040246.1 hypothetical protein [Xanthomonas euvesicatoria pv. allii]MCP3052017.1 hypothetical protein [Xanthomonas euvesicatoria pv. allii]